MLLEPAMARVGATGLALRNSDHPELDIGCLANQVHSKSLKTIDLLDFSLRSNPQESLRKCASSMPMSTALTKATRDRSGGFGYRVVPWERDSVGCDTYQGALGHNSARPLHRSQSGPRDARLPEGRRVSTEGLWPERVSAHRGAPYVQHPRE